MISQKVQSFVGGTILCILIVLAQIVILNISETPVVFHTSSEIFTDLTTKLQHLDITPDVPLSHRVSEETAKSINHFAEELSKLEDWNHPFPKGSNVTGLIRKWKYKSLVPRDSYKFADDFVEMTKSSVGAKNTMEFLEPFAGGMNWAYFAIIEPQGCVLYHCDHCVNSIPFETKCDKSRMKYARREDVRNKEWNENIRFHLPIAPQKVLDDIYFVAGGKRVLHETGRLHYFDAALPHYVANIGEERRFVLVVDIDVEFLKKSENKIVQKIWNEVKVCRDTPYYYSKLIRAQEALIDHDYHICTENGDEFVTNENMIETEAIDCAHMLNK